MVLTDLEEVVSAEEALRESEERYRELTELAPVGIGVIADDKIAFVNAAALRLLGAESAEQVIGKPPAYITHPDSLEEVRARIRGVAFGEQDLFPSEAVCLRLDGTGVDVEITATSVSFGGVAAIQVVLVDITERKNAEREILRLNRELEERVRQRTIQLEAANQELEAFSYSVSHDLRAPLRHIAGFSGILAEHLGETADDEVEHCVETISRSVNEMGVLIDDLLQFSRISRAEMQIGHVDMLDIVCQVLGALSSECSERHVELLFGELPPAVGDAALLRQVWTNLLSNAFKYTRPRDRAVIEIGARRTAGETEYSIRDNGVGFDMEHAGKLFGVFERLHSSGEFEGTGIGLANVKRVILRHGGRVWAEAAVETGATFSFTLPDPVAAS